MTDWSHIRTLDQLQAERVHLEKQTSERKALVERDVKQIQHNWQSRIGVLERICRTVEYLIPKPQPKTILGALSSVLIARFFRRKR